MSNNSYIVVMTAIYDIVFNSPITYPALTYRARSSVWNFWKNNDHFAAPAGSFYSKFTVEWKELIAT